MAQVETEKRRFHLLEHLAQTPGYELGDELLEMGLNAQGCPSTNDQARAALAWLAEVELVRLRGVESGMVIATLTRTGSEVASGRRIMPGVLRPRPAAR